MAFSATGFLLTFLTCPMTSVMPTRLRVESSSRAIKPGAGSTLTRAGGPSDGCNSLHKRPRASRSVTAFSF